ncbi:MAG: HD domain-containing protein [Syntrophorhabdales bacterium]
MDKGKDLWKDWVPVLENALAEEMERAPAICDSHALDHILRVWDRCILLGEGLDADMEVLVAAAYLHDVGRHYLADRAHGALSAQKAAPMLERINFPEHKRESALHAIRVHDVSAKPAERTTIESKILYDADKMDAMGVIGVLRYIRQIYGKRSIDFILEDIELRWQGFALPATRRLALKDYEYVRRYFTQLKQELRQ